MFQTEVVEKAKTHILYLITFFVCFESRVVYEIRRKNIVEPYRPQITIWGIGSCALHAGYPRLQTHTVVICNTCCFSTATMVTRTHLDVTYIRTLPAFYNLTVDS